MLFDTPIYFLFLSVVVLVYWRLGWRRQNLFLLAGSYFFYGWWDWRFLSLIAISTVVDYHCARYIAASQNPTKRRALLILSLSLNLGFLGFFKYYGFFVTSLAASLSALGVDSIPLTVWQIILPPGISFYTFQAVAYIVDIYHGKLEPSRSLVDYALFISLFPHLIAGPIQRPFHLLPQVQTPRRFDEKRFFSGLMLILSGLFRKCVVADNCALIANAAFGGKFGPTSLPVIALGTYAFAWQIYGDFSGYSDIARGSAQLLGFHFMVNFRQPYLAQSVKEFWRRWHISLSSWLRDYLYIPLGGSRNGERQTCRNLMLTMLLGGLWHGASWTFVIWGGLHGVGLAIERMFASLVGAAKATSSATGFLATWLTRAAVFHLVCLTWIFFRVPSVSGAVRFLAGLGSSFQWRPEFTAASRFLAIFILPMLALDLAIEHSGTEYLFEGASLGRQVAFGLSLATIVLLFSGNQLNAFIYFQF